ncbi:MAG TPA: thiol reductant ABC exporter subunit CydC [Solirubrobacteraceae bacterium]|jgi:thiol reductant ABC exporter CydC subunit
MSGAGLRALMRVARPRRGERARLALAVALAGGAAAAAVALLATSGYLISRAAQRPEILTLMVTIVAVRAFGIVRAGLRYGERLATHDLALRRLAWLRLDFFRSLVPRVPGRVAGRGGEMLSRFVSDVDTLGDLHPRVMVPASLAVLVVLGAAVAAWTILPAAGVTVLVSLALSAVLLFALSARASARAARRQAPARARLTSELLEGIDGAVELSVAGRVEEHIDRVAASDARLARIARGDALAGALASVVGELLAGAGVIAILIVAVPAVHSGALAGVMVAAVVFLLLAAQESILPLAGAARTLNLCATAAGRLAEVGASAPTVLDPAVAVELPAGRELSMHGVVFGYGAEEPLVLDGIELRIGTGERVALTGPSGGGKSTLGELLVRFHDPLVGSVEIDGVDLRELAQEDVRSLVLVCSQDCHVFNTTLRENLLLARRDADEDAISRALGAVELDLWAAALPLGLDTLVGQDGELVSGGQRTRIALARALLRDARFLVLDEPTAHLDPDLAARVLHNVLEVCDDRGLLVITHELVALEGFDRILTLEHGAIETREPLGPVAVGA